MNNQLPKVGIGVFVFKEGKFLMGRRHGAHGAGSWALLGGHLEFGESFEETASREVMEETGLFLTNIRFGAITNDVFEDEGKHYVTIWMLSDYAGGQESIREPDKFLELQWYDLDHLPDGLFLPWQHLLASPFIEEIRRQAASGTAQNEPISPSLK